MDAHDVQKKKFLSGQRWTGLLLLLVGGALLLRQSGYPVPFWLFHWPMLLIVIGFLSGLRSGFRDFSWLIMIAVGSVFLADMIYPELNLRKFAVPGLIIFFGLVFFLMPRGRSLTRRWDKRCDSKNIWRDHVETPVKAGLAGNAGSLPKTDFDTSGSMDTSVDIVSVFSGVKKKILSKSFIGGDVVCIFGGAELNLTNADFISPIRLDFTQIFGGTKLIVPANWEIRSELTAIFGGIEDKRQQPPNTIAERTIILDGTVIFGGVEVNSF